MGYHCVEGKFRPSTLSRNVPSGLVSRQVASFIGPGPGWSAGATEQSPSTQSLANAYYVPCRLCQYQGRTGLLNAAAFSRDRGELSAQDAYLASETLDAVVATIHKAHGWHTGKPPRRTRQALLPEARGAAVSDAPVNPPASNSGRAGLASSSSSSSFAPPVSMVSWDYAAVIETSSLIICRNGLGLALPHSSQTEAEAEEDAAAHSTLQLPINSEGASSATASISEHSSSMRLLTDPEAAAGQVPARHGPGPEGMRPSSSSSNTGMRLDRQMVLGPSPDNWLDAVLSVPTNRLSLETDEAIIHSLNRLASIRYTPAGEQLQELLEGVRWRFTSFQLQHFEALAANLARLGHRPAQDWWAAFERSSAPLIRGGSPRILSHTLQSLAQLGHTPSPSWLSAGLEEIRLNPGRMSLHSWGLTLWALAKMRQAVPQSWLGTFYSSSLGRLSDATATQLTTLLWSLSRLQQPMLPPSHSWLQRYEEDAAALARAGSYSHEQLAVSICSAAAWAESLGMVGKGEQELQGRAPDVILGPLVSLVGELLEAAAAQLHLMHPADISNVLCALGKLGFNPPTACLPAFLSALQEQLPRLTPAQLSSLCWALAKLPGSSISPDFLRTLQLELAAQMQGLPLGGLGKVLWALAKVHARPCRKFTAGLWEELEHRCGAMSSRELSSVLWSLNKLHLQPPGQWLAEALGQGQEQLAGLAAGEAAQMTWALASLGHNPTTQWLVALEGATLSKLGSALLEELVNLHCGMARLGHTPSPSWEQTCIRELQLRCAGNGLELQAQEVRELLQEALLSSQDYGSS